MPRTTFDPSISDHALLRWLERVHGINMAHYRAELLRMTEHQLSAGATTWYSGPVKFVARNGVLITIVDEDGE